MDRSEAFRRLADVMNLTDDVAVTAAVVEVTDAAIDMARGAVEVAEANHQKALDAQAAAEDRLEDAQSLVAEIPADLLTEVGAELAAKRATRSAFVNALAALDAAGTDSHAAALADVHAAAEAAGATVVHAEPGEVGSTGEGTS